MRDHRNTMMDDLEKTRQGIAALRLEYGWYQMAWGVRGVVVVPGMIWTAYLTVMPEYVTEVPAVFVLVSIMCGIVGLVSFLSGVRSSGRRIRGILDEAARANARARALGLILASLCRSALFNWFPPQDPLNPVGERRRGPW